MSVHGEYARALENLRAHIQQLDTPSSQAWAARLEKLRSADPSDLSTAASECLRLLDALDAERNLSSAPGIGPAKDALREPFLSLRAHCRAVLGQPDALLERE